MKTALKIYKRLKKSVRKRQNNISEKLLSKKQGKVKERYNAQTQYVKWVDLKKTITGIKKELGIVNYEIVMSEIEKLERFKHS